MGRLRDEFRELCDAGKQRVELPEEPAFLRLRGAVVRSQAGAGGAAGGFALRFEDASLSDPVRDTLMAFLSKRLLPGE